MSGFYLLGLIGIWLVIGWIVYRLWRLVSVKKPVWSAVNLTIGIALLAAWVGVPFWMAMGKKIYFDNKVNELCAKDGGIRVYETVKLPAGRFNQWNQINFFRPNKGEDALGPEYVYKSETKYIIKGEYGQIGILRHHDFIYRRSNNKLLGEQIGYARRGGDLPGPWHPSSFSCPDFRGNSLLRQVFVKSEEKGDRS